MSVPRVMLAVLPGVLLGLLSTGLQGCLSEQTIVREDGTASFADVKYGPHPRNTLDVWLAKSDVPTPLIIYIHGGGFLRGDKSKIHGSEELAAFLKSGISVASINYRFRNVESSTGIQDCLNDSKRSLQFIRSKATEWNLDKDRIGCYGDSAGAGTSLWLAFHNDMADPKSPDPILRESTRISVAGALGTQATYDFLRWPDLLPIVYPNEAVEQAARRQAAAAYGFDSVSDLESPEGFSVRADLDLLNLMSGDDPPFFVRNPQQGGPVSALETKLVNHHPQHAIALKKRAEELGLEAHIDAPALGVKTGQIPNETLVAFLIRHLQGLSQPN